MIHVTRLGGQEIVINSDLIEYVETTPDTIVTLTTGKKLLVRESAAEITARVLAFRRSAAGSHPLLTQTTAVSTPDSERGT